MSTRRTVLAAAIALAFVACTDTPTATDTVDGLAFANGGGPSASGSGHFIDISDDPTDLRNFTFTAHGDGKGQVGAGLGKALVIPDAVRKGNAIARRDLVTIPLKGSTIPHEITVKKGASIVIIKPAREGTGIIAAGAMRAMLELGGVRDVVGKSLGSRNPINIVKATLEALRLLRDPEVELARRLGDRANNRSRS